MVTRTHNGSTIIINESDRLQFHNLAPIARLIEKLEFNFYFNFDPTLT